MFCHDVAGKLVGLSCLCWQESLFVLRVNEFSYRGAYYVKFTYKIACKYK